jgi:hypothetical protein
MEAFWIVVIGTSIWMAFDAKQIGYDKKDVKGMAGMGPAGWFFGGLLLWIVVFPLYLASRNKLKAAASGGASTPTDGTATMAETPKAAMQQPADQGGQGGMTPLVKKLGTAVAIFFGGWFVLALGWNVISASSVSRGCEDAINARLRNPESASISLLTSEDALGEASPKMGTFLGYYEVNAQNGFGGFNRERWACFDHKGQKITMPY